MFDSSYLNWDSLPDYHNDYAWDILQEPPKYNIICDANSLYDAMLVSRKDTAWKPSVQKFCWNYLSNISDLQRKLVNLEHGIEKNAFTPGNGNNFFVRERGKVRAITGQTFADRVVSHSLNDNALIPAVRKYLIYDNTASLKNRGVDMARSRLRVHLKRAYQQYGTNSFYIELRDYSKYYDNIQTPIAYKMICEHTSDVLARRLARLMLLNHRVDVSYMSDEEYANCMNVKFDRVAYRLENHPQLGKRYMYKSLHIGDQTSQTVGILYAYQIDNLAKIVYGVKGYARYNDDSYLIGNDKNEISMVSDALNKASVDVGLFVNLRKTHISRADKGFVYLQHHISLSKNGVIKERIKSVAYIRMRRRLKKLKKKAEEGKVPIEDIVNMYRSWICSKREFISYRQLHSLELLMLELYGRKVYDQIYDHDGRWHCT